MLASGAVAAAYAICIFLFLGGAILLLVADEFNLTSSRLAAGFVGIAAMVGSIYIMYPVLQAKG